jgi:hypothetical protein
MRRFNVRYLAVFACLVVVSCLAAYQIQGGAVGLPSPTTTITFDAQAGFYDGYPITNQYQSQGATFSGFGWDNMDLGQAGSIGFSGGDLVSGFVGFPGPPTTPPVAMTISFANVVSGAAFAAVDNGGQYMVTAFRGSTQVDSFMVSVGAAPGGYIGFANTTGFDSITITPTVSSSLSIDSLQFTVEPGEPGGNDDSDTVPEPASFILISLGLAVFAAYRHLAQG